MKSYPIKHILPTKAFLLSIGSLLLFAALGIFFELEMHMGKTIAGIPFLLGAGLLFYFSMFYTEGKKVVQLSNDFIITEEAKMEIKNISSFKLKDDNPEIISLKLTSITGQKILIGTRTSHQEEFLIYMQT